MQSSDKNVIKNTPLESVSNPVTVEMDSGIEIELEIVKLESRLSYYRRRKVIISSFLGGVALIGSFYLFFGKQILGSSSSPLYGIALIAYGLFGIAYFSLITQSRSGLMQQDLNVLRAKKQLLNRALTSIDQHTSPSYFDRLVDINVTNLDAYYGLVKVHTNNSFLFSMSAGCIGFLLIVTGLIMGFTNVTNAQIISYVSAGAGIITEFIAGVFFYLYNRTVIQLKEYHDSLIHVQNILLSFKIVGDTKDDTQRNAMMELMMKCLIAPMPKILKKKKLNGSDEKDNT